MAAAALAAAALAACARAPSIEAPPTPGDRLEARVDGEAVWTSDVLQEAWTLGLAARGERLGRGDPRFVQARDERIDEILLAREAARRGLDHPAAERRRLAAERERALGDLVLRAVVDKAADPERVRRIEADLAGASAAAPPQPVIVRFLSYQAVKDLILTLRQGARIETFPTRAGASGAPAAAPSAADGRARP